MFEDFQSQKPATKSIQIDKLVPEEQERLREAGLALEKFEEVAVDLLQRLENSPLDANTLNEQILAELNQEADLAGLHPDVAESIRDSLTYNKDFTKQELAQADKDVDEDAGDTPPPPKEDLTQSEQLVNTLQRIREKELDMYAKSLTDEDRNKLLAEIITGERFSRQFQSMQGKLIFTLHSISAEETDQISEAMSRFVNDKVNGASIDEFNAKIAWYRQAAQLASVVVNQRVVYTKPEKTPIDALARIVYNGPANSQTFRILLAEASREMTGLLLAAAKEMGSENFTAPRYGDTG